jgi:lysine-N-methylase
MSLPIVTTTSREKWDCHQCGACCRGSVIVLSPDDLSRLRNQGWDRHPEYRKKSILKRMTWLSNRFRLAHRPDGSCVFLAENGQCRIHAEFGYDSKPTVCRVFPLQLVPTEKQAYLTVRRACPSAASDRGESVDNHLTFIRHLVRDGHLRAKPIAAPMLKSGEQRPWPVLGIALEGASGLLRDQRYPPIRRLVHALQFAHLLQRAKTKSLSDAKLQELIQVLIEVVATESKQFFEERQKPSAYARVFFRQMAIEFARLHPEFRLSPKGFGRLKMIKTGWTVFMGRGRTPNMEPPFPRVDFKALEQPFLQLAPSIEQPLARLIETLSESYLYAIADRQRWSLIESLRGLAILYPIGLWLLRWTSHGRAPTLQDIVNIIVALDRGQGFHPLTGTLQRSRLSVLGSQNQLERLAVWYSQ